MKQFILLFCIVTIILLTSCRNKGADDDVLGSEKKEYFLFGDEMDYSYEGYEIGVGTGYSQIFPFSRGESGLILYRVSYDYLDNLSDRIYKLDSVTFLYPKKEWIDSLDYYSIPVFDKEIPVNKFGDVFFHFKGFKQFNREFEDFSHLSGYTNEGVQKEFEFLYKEKPYRVKRELIRSNQYTNYANRSGMGSNHSITIEQGEKKQCIFKSMDNTGDITVRYHFIGDLDGDENIDFIVYINTGGYYYFILYLSSEAEEGEIVKHVATTVVPYQNWNITERQICTIKGSTERIKL